MIAKIGESRQHNTYSGTYSGIEVNTHLVAANANARLAVADFDPQNVTIKVLLKRNNKTHIIFQDNLLILGMYNTILKNNHAFVTGLDLIPPASGVKHNLLRGVRLEFGGNIRVNTGDVLMAEITLAKAGYSANISQVETYVEFDFIPSVGYEVGIPSTVSQVVQNNTTKETFALGDNVTDIAFLNFNKNGYENPVFNNINLASDKLDLSLNYTQAITRHLDFYANTPNERYGSTLPIHPTDATGRVFKGSHYLPQSVVIISGDQTAELDNVRVDISFNSSEVVSSANYLVHTKFETSLQIVNDAIERKEKHDKENLSKLPSTL